jgi:purine-binding chemotaxis protein CheW
MSDEQSRLITRVANLDGDKRIVMLIDPSQLLGAREMQRASKHIGRALPALSKAAEQGGP